MVDLATAVTTPLRQHHVVDQHHAVDMELAIAIINANVTRVSRAMTAHN